MLCVIPIEIVNRELDAVLYLALHLARRGLPTLFGDYMVRRILFKLNAGKPVVYFDQDQHLKTNNAVLAAGGLVFNLNQEGLVLEESLEQPDYERAIKSSNMLFAWGEAGKENICSRIAENKRTLVQATGHPSFDLANERFMAFYHDEEIVGRHGEGHIQVNTNFSYGNSKMDFGRYIKMLAGMDEWKVYADPNVQAYVWHIHDHQKLLVERYIKLVKRLSLEFPDRHIVLRPHPGEDAQRYLRAFSESDNVFVEEDKAVRNWIASASCVIHHDCTTGMEALLMGKPVFGYRPIPDTEATSSLFGKMGMPAENVDEVVGLVRNGTMDRDVRTEQLSLLKPYLANLETEAAGRIADIVASMTDSNKIWVPGNLGWVDTVKCWRKYFSKIIRSHQPGHNGKKVRYALEKFPRTPLESVAARLERLRAVDSALPPVKIEQLALNAFLMQPRKS